MRALKGGQFDGAKRADAGCRVRTAIEHVGSFEEVAELLQS